MKIAAIQHRVRESAEADARALAEAAMLASGRGAELIVFPDVRSLQHDDAAGHALLTALVRDVPAFCIVPSVDPHSRGVAIAAALPESFSAGAGQSGVAASLMFGDACMDAAALVRMAAHKPALAVLSPRCETDLQAEAMLEFAIGLSDSLAGVIVIAECAGAEPLEPGHGGSAMILLGDVMAEALHEDDVLLVEVPLPFPQPFPREPLPPVPPLLEQRMAHHDGRVAIEHGPDVS
jgi:hypothetical protein